MNNPRDDDEEIIQQIIPASGWYAEFERGGEIFRFPVVCWAIIDNNNGIPLVKGLLPLEESTMLWTPDELMEWYPSDGNESNLVFLRYAQVRQP